MSIHRTEPALKSRYDLEEMLKSGIPVRVFSTVKFHNDHIKGTLQVTCANGDILGVEIRDGTISRILA